MWEVVVVDAGGSSWHDPYSGSKLDSWEDCVSWLLGELVSVRLRLLCGSEGLVLWAFLRHSR